MDEKVRQFLKSREKDFELLQNGKVRCLVTNHEMPARIEDLQKHIAGKKFKMQKECYSVDFSKYAPDIVPSKKPKKLWCKVTQMQLNAIPEEIEKHINGRKFRAAKAQRELQKQAKKKKLEELQPEDGPDVALFADALSDSIDIEEPSSSKEEAEEAEGAEEEEADEEHEEDEEEEEALADPFASEEEEEEGEQEQEKKSEKKQKQVQQPNKQITNLPQKPSQPQNGKQNALPSNASQKKHDEPKRKHEETKRKHEETKKQKPQPQQQQQRKGDDSKNSKAAEHLPPKESNNKKKQKN